MKNKEQILTELLEIAPGFGRVGFIQIPFAVPDGYFDDFVENLMTRIQLEGEGFMDTSAREIAGISPLLASLQNKNPYQVPEGFFDGLKMKIPESETQLLKAIEMQSLKSDSKAIRIRRISLPMRIVRFAAAACFVALIGVAVLNTGNHQNTVDPIEGLTNVSDQDMANYMDSDDIHWTPGIASSPSETASIDFSDNDIHELLSSVPDAELEQYADALSIEKRSVN